MLAANIKAVSIIAWIILFGSLAVSRFANSDQWTTAEWGPHPELASPQKQLIPKVKIAKAMGWPKDATKNQRNKPLVPVGFAISPYAVDLQHPRWLYVLPNGDVLVAETNAPTRPDDATGLRGWFMKKMMKKAGAGVPSPNRITLLRDANHDGIAEARYIFAGNLNSPFGMTLIGEDFYIANTDAVVRFRYTNDAQQLIPIANQTQGELIATLPAGSINHHWTKNIIASPDGRYLYATVGSNSNVGENGINNEERRACILKVDLATRDVTIYASGLRNPNGLAWQPDSQALWTAVNERDEIGDLLVPDYITSVREGAFYGWPYMYYGDHEDSRIEVPNNARIQQATAPDYAVGAHTASLGLTFYVADEHAPNIFPEHYRHGAFIGQHGSWNRSQFAGYKVAFVPFDKNGHPSGPIEDFVTGFLNEDNEAMGRPVGVIVDASGALLVADDVGNTIWRVTQSPKLKM